MSRTNRSVPRSEPPPDAAAGRGRRVGFSTSGWIEALAADAAGHPERRKSCILLWMTGGPSQTDTFDPKPGHANGGEFKAIETAVPGILISQHLPKLAKQMKDIAIIRSMSTKEGDHGRATFNLRTGYQQQGRSATRPWARSSPRSLTTSRPSCRTSSASRRSGRSTRRPSARGSSGRSTPL